MDVSIIIVNYNTKELLYDCLKSIYEHTTGISFEVVVVDNASIKSVCILYFPISFIGTYINLNFGLQDFLTININNNPIAKKNDKTIKVSNIQYT